jgi:glycosyltransferase involved in cell wall biosynthesis
LAHALVGEGHDVTCIYTKAPFERVPAPELPYRVRWALLPAFTSRRAAPLRPLSAFSVARVAASLELPPGRSVLHGQGEESAFLPALAKRRRAASVLTLRYPSYPPALSGGAIERALCLARAPKFAALDLAVRGAECCSVTSLAARRAASFAFGIEPEALKIVPNGVAPEFASVTRSSAPEKLVFWGRLAPSKGIDTLLQAAARLGERCPPIEIIGAGDRRWVLATAERLGLRERVALLGPLLPATLAERLSFARLAVLPSFEESFGNSMLESLVAQVPLVTTLAGSIPEVVPREFASFVSPGDAGELAVAIARVLQERSFAEERAARARSWALAHYSWQASARQFVKLYEAVLSGEAREETRGRGLNL